MSNVFWTTTPASVCGSLAVRPAAAVTAPAPAAPAPAFGTHVPSVRLRALAAVMPSGTAADARYIDDIQKQNTSNLGIHSPGRPLS